MVSFLTFSAFSAESGECGEVLTWEYENGVLIISGDGYMYDFETTGEERAPWYGNNVEITEVIITDGVTSIGRNAFFAHSSIEKVTFGKDVKTIAYNAFRGCTSIAELVLNEGLEVIEYDAFKGCNGIKKLVFPSTVKVVEKGNFNYAIDELHISDLTKWFSVEFSGDASSPLAMAKKLFVDEKCVDVLEIPEGVEEISSRTLEAYHAIKALKLPSKLKFIGGEEIDIDSLERLYIEDLTSFFEIGYEGYDSFSFYADEIYVNNKLVTNLVVPEGVKEIRRESFVGYSMIKSVTLPASVEKIEISAFANSNIEKFIVSEDNLFFSSDEQGVLFDKEKTLLIKYPRGNESTEYTIPETVKTIGGSSFEYAQNLKSVFIPDSVEAIENYAFLSSNIECIEIPGSVAIIKKGAFEECICLEYANIGEGNEEIGYDAFRGCVKLKSVSLPESLTDIGSSAFYGCSLLSDIMLPNGIDSISSELFYECESLTAVTIPENVECVGNYAFYGCKNLEAVDFKGDVEVISHSAFYGCGFENITLPESLKTIEKSAFFGCVNLKSISVPSGVEYIADRAFMSCKSLEILTLESSCDIPAYTFKGCNNLKEVFITGDVSEISKKAFEIDKASFTIFGKMGSYVQSFALENLISFVDVSEKKSGDFNSDGCVDMNDAILLLQYSIFPDMYSLDCSAEKADLTCDGIVDMNDAVLLLQHSLFPEIYPIG